MAASLVKIERRPFLGQVAAVTNNVLLSGATAAPTNPPASGDPGVVSNAWVRVQDADGVYSIRAPYAEVVAVFAGTVVYTSIDVTMAFSRKSDMNASDTDADTWIEPDNTVTLKPPPATRSPGDNTTNVARFDTGGAKLLRFRVGNVVGGDATSDVVFYVYARPEIKGT